MARPKKVTGLGDVIENVTKATGIKKVVDKVSQVLDIDCGCDERKELLNKLFPIGRKVKYCLNEEDTKYLEAFLKNTPSMLYPIQQRELSQIYKRVFDINIDTSCSDCWRQYIKDLRTVFETTQNKDEKTT